MSAMPSLLDIAERSQSGPRVEEMEWNMGLFRKMTELTKKHEIACPTEPDWFNLDDSLPERAFRAAVEFLAQKGVYCVTTGRVIQFTEEEITQALREQPSRILVGEGRDRRVMEKHPLEHRGPFSLFPGLLAPFSEEYAPLIVKNQAQIPETSYIAGFNSQAVDGREIFGMPIEAYAARRQVAWMREGVRKAGRPGLAIVYYPVNTRAASMLAPMDPDSGLRRTDGVLLSVLPDVKVEHDLLTAALVYQEYGAFKVNHGNGRYGGFVGGYEGAAIEGIIDAIVGWMAYRTEISKAAISSTMDSTGKPIKLDRKGIWAVSVVCQALNRFTNCICSTGRWEPAPSGAGTESCLWLCASEAIQSPINGAHLRGYRQTRAQMNTAQTPFETEFKLEVSRAVARAGLTRATTGRVMDGIAARLDGRPSEEGLPISECYDLVNHRPSAEYREMSLRVKDELAGMGLRFD